MKKKPRAPMRGDSLFGIPKIIARPMNHSCHCGHFGSYGYGDLKVPEMVKWYCRDHRPQEEANGAT